MIILSQFKVKTSFLLYKKKCVIWTKMFYKTKIKLNRFLIKNRIKLILKKKMNIRIIFVVKSIIWKIISRTIITDMA